MAKTRLVFTTWLVFAFTLNAELCYAQHINAQRINVAVSSNFLAPLTQLQLKIEAECDCEISMTAGASGVLAAQFANGAPFDLLLSADTQKPDWLFEQGFTLDPPVTYAIGKLVLLDKHRQQVLLNDLGKAINTELPMQIAIANAKTAPYGIAAESVLNSLNDRSAIRIIRGNNVMQVMQFFTTGAVDQAIVSASLVAQFELPFGSAVELPTDLHSTIEQQAVVNKRGNPEVALQVLKILTSQHIQQNLADLGYQPIEAGGS